MQTNVAGYLCSGCRIAFPSFLARNMHEMTCFSGFKHSKGKALRRQFLLEEAVMSLRIDWERGCVMSSDDLGFAKEALSKVVRSKRPAGDKETVRSHHLAYVRDFLRQRWGSSHDIDVVRRMRNGRNTGFLRIVPRKLSHEMDENIALN